MWSPRCRELWTQPLSSYILAPFEDIEARTRCRLALSSIVFFPYARFRSEARLSTEVPLLRHARFGFRGRAADIEYRRSQACGGWSVLIQRCAAIVPAHLHLRRHFY